MTAAETCFAQLWIQGRRQQTITSRVAKDVINNVCEVNLNLAYVSQESLMIDYFAFLEMGVGVQRDSIHVNWHCYRNNKRNPWRPFRCCWNQISKIILMVLFPVRVLKHVCKGNSNNNRRHKSCMQALCCAFFLLFSIFLCFSRYLYMCAALMWLLSRNNCRQQTSLCFIGGLRHSSTARI